MADFGMKISKPGKDVGSATNANLHYSSKFNILKIFKEGGTTVSHVSSGHTNPLTQIAHGLQFTPTFLAYIEASTGEWMNIGADASVVSDVDFVALDTYSDATNLNLSSRVSSFSSVYNSNPTFNVYYFIFGDTAKEANTTTNMPTPKDIGIKITKPGTDVSSTVIEKMLFHSEMPSLMIKAQGSTSITSAGTTTIAHGLTYIPAYLVMVSNDDITYNLTFYGPNVDGPTAYGWVDATNLNLRSFNFSGQTHYFRYIIFANKIAD